MSNLKYNFSPNSYALAEEINQNFQRIEFQDKWNENLTSQIDGTKTTFTTPDNFMPGSLRVYLDKLRLIPNEDYTEIGSNQFVLNMDAPEIGATLLVDYRIAY